MPNIIPPNSLPPFSGYGQYSPYAYLGGGRMPDSVGSIMMQVFGHDMWPIMNGGTPQSQFDAVWRQQHSLQMINMARQTAASFYPISNLGGINRNSLLGNLATSLMAQPDGVVANAMAPLLGGNPIQAQMASLASLQGVGASGLGTLSGTSIGQLNQSREFFENQFYNKPTQGRAFDSWLSDGGHRDIKRAALDQWQSTGSGAAALAEIEQRGIRLRMDPKDIAELKKGFTEGVSKASSGIVRGVNFSQTYGFNYEDLIGARNQAINSRLFAGKDINALSALAGGGSGGAFTGALDSARSLFGNNLSGKELMQKMSDFVGNSKMSLDNTKDLGNFQDMARTMKATARELNIGIDELLNMSGQAQAFGSQHAATAKLGGMEIAPMISREAVNVSAAASGMSSDQVRWLGGTSGMLASRVQGEMESMNQPITKQVSALRTYFANDPRARAQIDQYIDNGDFTNIGYNQFLQTLPGNTSQLMMYAQTNVNAQQSGFRDLQQSNPALAAKMMNMGSQAKVSQALQTLSWRYGAGEQGTAMANRALGFIGQGDLNGLMNDPSLNAFGLGPMWKNLADSGDLTQMVTQLNPTARRQTEVTQGSIQATASIEAQLASQMGKMNAPIMTRLAQAVASGDTEGISGIGKALGITPESGQYGDILGAARTTKQILGATDVKTAAQNSGLFSDEAAGNLSEVSSLATKYGFSANDFTSMSAAKTPEAMRKIMGNPTAFDEELERNPNVVTKFNEWGDWGTSNLGGYTGGLGLDSLQTHLAHKIGRDVTNKITDIAGFDTKSKDILEKRIRYVSEHGDPRNEGLAAFGLWKTSAWHEDLFQFHKDFSSEVAQQAAPGTPEAAAGKVRLGANQAEFATMIRGNHNRDALDFDPEAYYSPEENEQHRARLEKALNASGRGELFDQYDTVHNQHDQDADNEANTAANNKMGLNIQQIMNDLPKLTAALGDIQKTLATE